MSFFLFAADDFPAQQSQGNDRQGKGSGLFLFLLPCLSFSEEIKRRVFGMGSN
jgi:hypothetical protein